MLDRTRLQVDYQNGERSIPTEEPFSTGQDEIIPTLYETRMFLGIWSEVALYLSFIS